jgi:ATP-dependent exoDNAse (exonuclease V) alpha subunit
VAIYHLSVKTISRSAGRSATAAAAYRSGVKIADELTGEIHDYTRKRGVEFAEMILPAGAPEWASDRAALWNAAEQAEKRKNSTVAREFEVALPSELPAADRQRVALDLALEIVEQHSCIADVAIHAPGKEGDNRNYHAHILLSTRRLGPEGFTQKTRELDDQKTGAQIVTKWRERFASLMNQRMSEAGIEARVDHRSFEAQGIERLPTRHLGPGATNYERRTGKKSRRRLDFEAQAQEVSELERESRQVEQSISDLTAELESAKIELKEQAAKSLLDNIFGIKKQQVEQYIAKQEINKQQENKEQSQSESEDSDGPIMGM